MPRPRAVRTPRIAPPPPAAGVPGRPPANHRDARRSARREALIDAAIAAIEANGDDVTMTAMAAAAGVTKPILYRYFGDRAGLYHAIAERFAAGLLDELTAALSGGPGGRRSVEQSIGAYLRYVEAYPQLYRFLATRLPAADPEGQRMVTGFVHRVARDVAGALREPLLAAGADAATAELVAFGLTGMIHLAGEAWMNNPSVTRSDAVAHLSALAWHGLAGFAGLPASTAPDRDAQGVAP